MDRIQDSTRRIKNYTVREVAPYINWTYYFHAWGMEPRFASIAYVHDCPSCCASWIASFTTEERPKAQEALKLFQEAKEMLGQWANKSICHAAFLLAEAYSDGDDIVINNTHIPFLRQQRPNKEGYTLCLSDFIAPKYTPEKREHTDIANRIGIFATTVSLPSNISSFDLQRSTLADRLAEATAEKIHEEVRRHYWGYAKEEQLTMQALHAEKFQGIRPAVGYPSLPDQSINIMIDELLHLVDIGIELSENGAMKPHCSVSGFMFAHPESHYFSVGDISEEQLTDYSLRRGLGADVLRNFLTNNLQSIKQERNNNIE